MPKSAANVMAVSAKKRLALLQQGRCCGAMRIMANRTVFGNRLMVMQKWAALLGVAFVASFIDAIFGQQCGTRRTMGVVAVGAGDLSFGDRMPGRTGQLRPLLLVAGVTNIGLGEFVSHLVLWRMNLMAGVAGYVPRLMNAAIPMRSFRILLVAGHAGRIARLGRRVRVLAKAAIYLRWLGAALVQPMIIAFAMTIHTAWRSFVGGGSVPGLANRKHRWVEFKHGGGTRRLVCLVMAAGAFCVTF